MNTHLAHRCRPVSASTAARLGVLFLLAAWPLAARSDTLVVTNVNDSGAGSLRARVTQDAAAGDVIVFDPAVKGTIVLTSGEIAISRDITIDGPGAGVLTLDGNSAGRIFNVSAGDVYISGLTLTRGDSGSGNGGAVLNTATLSISDCVISASEGGGGAAVSNVGGVLSISGSTLHSNTAANGGAIHSSGASLGVATCTFFDNHAQGRGGAILITGGVASISNVTISGNSTTAAADPDSGGGGLCATGGNVIVRNSLIAGNTIASGAGPDGRGFFSSGGYNLIGVADGSTGFGLPGSRDQAGSLASPLDPVIDSLRDNGGPTPTMALLAGSPAIDKGNSNGAPDQRGRVRAYNDPAIPDAAGGDASDIGAYELFPPLPTIATNLDDGGEGSLRQSIANAFDRDIIVIAAGLVGTIPLGEPLRISKHLTIIGPGADSVSLAGAGIVVRGQGTTVLLSGLSLTDAPTALDSEGDVTVRNCALSASTVGAHCRAGQMTFDRCTLAGNGVGVQVLAAGTVNLSTCTVSGNTFVGIISQGTLSAGNCTITANTAAQGGGIFNDGGVATLYSSIVAGNTAPDGPDLKGSFVSSGYNLIGNGDGSSGLTDGAGHDQVGSTASPKDAMLGPLADSGGPTLTHVPLAGSPAIDQGKSGLIAFDQRGAARVFDDPAIVNAGGGDGADIGAVEVGAPAPTPTAIATNTSSATPTAAATATPVITPSATATATPPAATATSLPTATAVDTALPTETPVATASPEATLTATEPAAGTPTESAPPSDTPSAGEPTATPSDATEQPQPTPTVEEIPPPEPGCGLCPPSTAALALLSLAALRRARRR